MTFTREDRYLVLKRSDIEAGLYEGEALFLDRLARLVESSRINHGKPPLKCVVVESDWPEYEPTWEAIQKRMEST